MGSQEGGNGMGVPRADTSSPTEKENKNGNSTTFYLPADLKDEFMRRHNEQLVADTQPLKGAAYHILDIHVNPTINEIDAKLEELRLKRIVAVTKRNELGFNIDGQTFAAKLEELIVALTNAFQIDVQHDISSGVRQILEVVKVVGYSSLNADDDQKSLTFGVMTTSGQTVTIGVCAFVHRAMDVNKEFMGFEYKNQRVNCHHCFYEIIISSKHLVPMIQTMLFPSHD